MALATQIGSPSQVIMTTPALTIDDIMDAEYNFNPELLEHFNGNSHYPRINVGNMDVQIKFKTTDLAAIAALTKGTVVEGVTLHFKPTVTGVAANGDLTQATGTISMTVSNMIVNEAVPITNDASKKPAEFQFSLKAVMDDTGADPTLTLDFTLGV